MCIKIRETSPAPDIFNSWLNPQEWIERIPEVVSDYPDRIIAKPGHEADLKKFTLTNIYNARPAWLGRIHKELDAAVAAAYGWDDYTPDMPDEEILARLFELKDNGMIKAFAYVIPQMYVSHQAVCAGIHLIFTHYE